VCRVAARRRVGTSAKVSPLARAGRCTFSHPPLIFGIWRSPGSCPRLLSLEPAAGRRRPRSSSVPFWSPSPLGRDREPKGRGRVRGAANLTRQANAGHSGGVPGWRLRTTQRTCFPPVFAGIPLHRREKKGVCQAGNYPIGLPKLIGGKMELSDLPSRKGIFSPIRPGVKEGASVRSAWPPPV
jgi:hypothetical protein